MVYRERFYVAHSQRLVGNITDLVWDANIAGFDNRLVTTLSSSYLDFVRPGAAIFPNDSVSLVDPVRGFYGELTTKQQTARIDNEALSFEDRLKLTRTFALVGGLRVEHIGLDRNSTDKSAGLVNAGFPFSKSWVPDTGRIGYTWEAVPGLTFFSQYATGADISANNIFLLFPTEPLDLTTARTYETGVKHLLWDNRAEWSFSAYDILRKNVYAAAGDMHRHRGTAGVQGRRAGRGRSARSSPCGSGATSPMSMRAMPTTILSAARSRATRRRTCRASSPMPARPIASPRPGRSSSASLAAMSATATSPMPTP